MSTSTSPPKNKKKKKRGKRTFLFLNFVKQCCEHAFYMSTPPSRTFLEAFVSLFCNCLASAPMLVLHRTLTAVSGQSPRDTQNRPGFPAIFLKFEVYCSPLWGTYTLHFWTAFAKCFHAQAYTITLWYRCWRIDMICCDSTSCLSVAGSTSMFVRRTSETAVLRALSARSLTGMSLKEVLHSRGMHMMSCFI